MGGLGNAEWHGPFSAQLGAWRLSQYRWGLLPEVHGDAHALPACSGDQAWVARALGAQLRLTR